MPAGQSFTIPPHSLEIKAATENYKLKHIRIIITTQQINNEQNI